MVNKITNFSDIAMEISENQYAQTLFMSQLRSNFLVDSLPCLVGKPFKVILLFCKLQQAHFRNKAIGSMAGW